MRELDAQSQDLQRRIEDTLAARIAELRERAEGGSPKEGSVTPGKDAHGKERQIEKDHDACAQLADKKVALAEQTYNLIDKHIRRLDTDLHRLQAEVKAERAAAAATAAAANPPLQEQPKTSPRDSNGDAHTPGGTQRKRGHVATGAPPVVPEAPEPPPVEINLEIDPNEPTYCYCQQVSFGEMVGCDNKDCEIQWFHFDCVGLTTKPRGKWYCPDCITKVKRKRTK
ncbi:PHD zinc finger superfamily protein [Klebsormidium nitens]|uniref:PHD finger protein ING n=1 Tax=Klebsormidium nitens TaxID=105231 RepID=A0A1Y1IDJ9_KLENI|nr:PHD zinc finger superfamily protein [Klebsormidium nitens]|eukprot:GAQ86797.1 PHD zinc finger superfamily protein [Klebsormidium nitens]